MRTTTTCLILVFLAFSAQAGPTPTPAATPVATPVATVNAKGAPEWEAWFKKNVMSSDKKIYVHIFWNAQDVKARFEGKVRVGMLAQAAVALTRLEYAKEATADIVKIDIVNVAERDEYGMPKWSSLKRIAHLEGSRAELLKWVGKPLPKKDADIQKIFTVFKLF